jgi:hypothetical protein
MNTTEIQISANEGQHFYEVLFFDTHKQAVAWVREQRGYDKPFSALTISRKYDVQPAPPMLGWLVFDAENFAPSIVQHELLHAAMHYERTVFGNAALSFADLEAEERLAHTQQDLLDDLLFKMEDAGLSEFGVAHDPAALPTT